MPNGESVLGYPREGEGDAATLVAHADRCWKAEEAIASRLTTKSNIVLTAIMGVLGFKLYALGKEIEIAIRAWERGWVRPVGFWALLAIGLVLLLIALAIVLEWPNGGRKVDQVSGDNQETGPQTASELLNVDKISNGILVREPWKMPKHIVPWLIYKHTYVAFKNLQARNADRLSVLDRSQRFVLVGIFFLFGSMVLFNWMNYDSVPKP